MQYTLWYSNRFKCQYRKLRHSGQERIVRELKKVMVLLAKGEHLPTRNLNHKLTGDFEGFYECHVLPDWLLIYRIYDDILVLELIATGTHSELFK